jgi:hypothetical protein
MKSSAKKRPEIWREHSWFIRHDNAASNSALSVKNLRTKTEPPAVPQLQCSTNLSHIFLSSTLKHSRNGCGLFMKKRNARKMVE